MLRLASGNEAKLVELAMLLAPRIRLEGPPAGFVPPPEDADDYAENALIKARALWRASGEPALADDSGLEVDALGGRPGVRSARYAPDAHARIERLLGELRGIGRQRRSARFRTVLAAVLRDGREVVADGSCEGWIADARRGASGFGYDPIFVSRELGRTFGEASPQEKARASARGHAARKLVSLLGV